MFICTCVPVLPHTVSVPDTCFSPARAHLRRQCCVSCLTSEAGPRVAPRSCSWLVLQWGSEGTAAGAPPHCRAALFGRAAHWQRPGLHHHDNRTSRSPGFWQTAVSFWGVVRRPLTITEVEEKMGELPDNRHLVIPSFRIDLDSRHGHGLRFNPGFQSGQAKEASLPGLGCGPFAMHALTAQSSSLPHRVMKCWERDQAHLHSDSSLSA